LDERRTEHAFWRNVSFASVVGVALTGGAAFAATRLQHSLEPRGHASELTRISYGPKTDKADPAVSLDGKVILFDATLAENRDSKYAKDDAEDTILACGQEVCLGPAEFTPRALHGQRSRWLPDGSGIVYVTTTKELRRTLAPTPLAKSELIVDAGSDEIHGLSVSPDGNQVVYAAGFSIYVVGLYDKTPKKIETGYFRSWSPDGRHIALARYDQIVVVDRTGHSASYAHRDTCKQTDPAWSPDGKYLLFTERCGGYDGVYRLCAAKLDGTGFEVLTSGDANVRTPTWSRDDVYFSAQTGKNYEIWRMHLTGPLAGHGRRR
jgi:WD40 repeat protein